MRLHFLLPSIKGIPVLMYHRVWPGLNDGLTITPEKLRQQWEWMRSEGYEALNLATFLDIASGKRDRPKKGVLITFDDGYYNNLEYLYPLAEEFQWPVTIFIICCTLDGTAYNEPDDLDKKLRVADLKKMNPELVQLGLHGYNHENFSETGMVDLQQAMVKSVKAFENSGLKYYKVLAYPYGARPKGKTSATAMTYWMKELGIKAAFRIGNKPESTPSANMYEIHRIDIRGTDSLEDFKIKIKKGKLKPF